MDPTRVVAALALVLCVSCGDDAGSSSGPKLAVEELMRPETCMDCHPKHYEEWRSSMHAYAADDPVFIAMNERARDDGVELGDFCIKCHAPMAVQLGEVTDIDSLLELSEDQSHLKGVTCYFCHNAVSVDGTHNAEVELGMDQTMRASIRDAVEPSAHFTAYSSLLDGNNLASTELCGGCHDIVTPAGVELERTFQEYQSSIFADPNGGSPDTCAGCHMPKQRGVVAEDPDTMVRTRWRHEHIWAGVDVAIDEFPLRSAQAFAVECELQNGTGAFGIEPNPAGEVRVTIGTDAGHNQPSGASQDRRLWLEIIGYDADGNVVFASGDIADDEIVDKPEDDPDHDSQLCLFRDWMYDDDGEEVHMFWEARSVEGRFLPPALGPGKLHTVDCNYNMGVLPERITARLRMRPMGLDVLQDLVDSGHLDEQFLAEMPTFTLHGTVMEWRREEHGFAGVDSIEPLPLDCPNEYRCEYFPEGSGCE